MNNLKTTRRSLMGNLLLRTLMTICELGKDWEDPTLIPVDDIVQEWRTESKRGRYESAMWRAAGLEEPNANANHRPREAAGEAFEAGAQVDNLEAGGFFARFGRERDEPRPTVIPRAATPVPAVPPTPTSVAEGGGEGPSGRPVVDLDDSDSD